MLYILIVFVLFLYLIDYLIHNSKYGKLIDKIPGDKPMPVVGNTFDFIAGPVKFFYNMRRMSNKALIHDKIMKIWIFHKPTVSLYDPDDIEILLSNVKYISKGYEYNFLHSWLNEGLLTSTGSKWQKRRKILTPTFHFNILRQFCNTFIERSEQLVKKLECEVGKSETDIRSYIVNFTLHTINETAMGIDLDSSRGDTVDYKKAIHDIAEIVVHRSVRAWLHPELIFSLTPLGWTAKKVLKTLHTFTMNVIRERRAARKESGEDFDLEHLDDSFVIKKRMAMLDLLLKAESEGQIQEDGIREEVDTFMFEGHDTTTAGITFFLMLIANHPDIQERVVTEQKEIFDDYEKPPTMEDFGKMNYLEMCLKESLRLFPSVPFISRMLTEDMQIKKYMIPAGTKVDINIIDIHRSPDLYKDPFKFDPDRFLPENTKARHPYAYIPFSAGPRNCIGQKFALLEMKVVASAILRKFKLEAITKPDDVIFELALILQSQNKIKIKISPRNCEEMCI